MLQLRTQGLGGAGRPLFPELELQIRKGERVVIFGASGAGKTTLLGALYGVAGARAALIPQPHGLVSPLTVAQNIVLGRIEQQPLWRNLRSLIRMPAAERRAVESCASAVDLRPQLDQPVATLSGGEQSRTAIARALYRGGELLLADEPCAALDPERSRSALEALAERFETLVVTMHDVRAGLGLATRVIGIAEGRVDLDRSPTDLREADLATLYAARSDTLPPGALAPRSAIRAPRGCA